MNKRSLLALGGLVALTASLAPLSGRAQEPTVPQKSPIETELTEINRALFFGGREPALKYAARIKALGKEKLSDDDRETWLEVARDAALRLGDRAWLESLKDVPDSFSREMIYKVLLAYGQLSKADLDGATKTLDGLKEADKRGEINVREQRRMTALRARIAQLRGENKKERAEIESLIEHLPYWPTPSCQRCHNAPAAPKEITSLPIHNLWFGERFVEILKRDGDARKLQLDSEAMLSARPTDDLARIRLAFALQAQGESERAAKLFAELPWTEQPERKLRKPRMVTSFP